MQNKKAEAQSKSQQRFMGMVYAYKDGTLDTSKLPRELIQKIKRASSSMTRAEVDDFASTRHKGLPEKKASMNKYIQQGFTAGIIKEALETVNKTKSQKLLSKKNVAQSGAVLGATALAVYAGARFFGPKIITRQFQLSKLRNM